MIDGKHPQSSPAMQRFAVPQLPLEGPKDLVLQFPAGWDVEMRPMAGALRPEVSLEAIREAVRNPIGTPALRTLATGKKQVAIIVDDNARGMRWNKIAHVVLEELEAAGIAKDSIRFVFALGNHGVMYRTQMVQKLGEDIVANYYCFNHNPFTFCQKIGTTKTWDVDVEANQEVMACDLKIGLGVIVPHPINGFGGGSKIVMPGVLSYDTIVQHHQKSFAIAYGEMNAAMKENRQAKVGLGLYDPANAPAVDADDEMAEMVGLDFIVDVTVNQWAKPVGVWAGDFRQAWRAGLDDARDNYATEGRADQDIVVANCFYKNSEDLIGIMMTPRSLKRSGGTVVLVSNCPEGSVWHYFQGMWGKEARVPHVTATTLADYVDRLIIYNEYPMPGSYWWLEPKEKIVNVSHWDDVLTILKECHSGNPSAVIYPDATIQFAAPKGNFLHHELVQPH